MARQVRHTVTARLPLAGRLGFAPGAGRAGLYEGASPCGEDRRPQFFNGRRSRKVPPPFGSARGAAGGGRWGGASPPVCADLAGTGEFSLSRQSLLPCGSVRARKFTP